MSPKPGEKRRKASHDQVQLLRDPGLLVLELKSTLSAEDFRQISRSIAAYIREKVT